MVASQHFIYFFQAHSENQSIASADQHPQQHVSAEIHVQVHDETHDDDEEESPYDIRQDTVSQNLK